MSTLGADLARAEELRERATRARLAGAEAAELDAEAERLAAAIRGRARVVVGMIDERLDALAG